MNPLIQGHSGTAPEMSWNVFSMNQGTNEDDSQSYPHPEAGLLTSGREDCHDMSTGVQWESVYGNDTGVPKERYTSKLLSSQQIPPCQLSSFIKLASVLNLKVLNWDLRLRLLKMSRLIGQNLWNFHFEVFGQESQVPMTDKWEKK